MKRLLLFLSAIICYTTLSFAAIGDKVYFINMYDWTSVLVDEYTADWSAPYSGQALTKETATFNGHEVYSYSVQSADCATLGFNNGTVWCSPAIDLKANAYYMPHYWESGSESGYWASSHTAIYDYTFYFVNTTEWTSDPWVGLWNVVGETWTGINADESNNYLGEAMTNLNKYLDEYKVWKYTYQSVVECTTVQFNDGVVGTEEKWNAALDADATKRCFYNETWLAKTEADFSDTPTESAIENVQHSGASEHSGIFSSKKVVRNGQMFIVRDGELFTVIGSKVK